MFFVVRSKDSFNFPLGWIKSIFIVVIIVIVMFVASLRDYHCTPCVWMVSLVSLRIPSGVPGGKLFMFAASLRGYHCTCFISVVCLVSLPIPPRVQDRTVRVCCVIKGLSLYTMYLNGLFSVPADSFPCPGENCSYKGLSLYTLYLNGLFSVSADSFSCPGQNCSCLPCHQGTIIVYHVFEWYV